MPTKKKTTRRSRPAPRPYLSRWIGWAAVVILFAVAAIALYFQNRSTQIVNTLPNEVTPLQAITLVSQGAIVIDVRTEGWFNTYRIPYSINVPYETLADNLALVPENVNLVVIDDLGDLAGPARDILLRNGYTAVTAVIGGITEWIEQGFYVEGTFPY